MMKTKKIITLIITVLTLGCSQNRFKIDTNESDLEIKIGRFDKDVFALDTNNIAAGIPALEEKYGMFFTRYTRDIMRIGTPDSAEFIPIFKAFLTDTMFRKVYEKSLQVFDNVSPIEKKLTIAFKYAQHYFPEKTIPKVYMHVSGFNQAVVVDEDVLSLSADDYLGSDYIYYQGLVYDYQLTGMTPEKVPSDYIMGWLLSEFPQETYTEMLLDNMLYRGKIMFLLETFMPGEKAETLMAYSPEQLKWCLDNEKQMWVSIIEGKHLFQNNRMTTAKYINEAPYTSFFPTESPGRTGIWMGWQIIKSYMKNNENVDLKELMNETDYRKILEKSGYRP